MGYQAGICYFDGREIAESEAATLRGWFLSSECERLRDHIRPGLFFAYAPFRHCGLSAAGTQPHVQEGGILTFDGRLDNRRDLLLEFRGRRDDEADAALVAAVYETRGAEGLAHLLGDWSLALWDARNKTMLLASDFAGVRPLYYLVDRERAVWSTRLDPLVRWAHATEIDDRYVAGFLAHGGCPNRTPYRRVWSVPPGCAVLVGRDGARTRRFWSLPVAATIRYSGEEEYEEQLRALFREAVKCRLAADSTSVCELSGGLDSSSVVSMASHLVRTGECGAARIVTLSFEHEGSIDRPFYTALEEFCGVQGIHLPTADFPFLTEAEPGEALPAFWTALLKRVSALAREMRAASYLTGLLGDAIMGNWSDDSEQVAGLLRRGRIGAALAQSLAWSKAARVPVLWILWRALQASLPTAIVPARRSPWTAESAGDETQDDSISSRFRKSTGLDEPGTFFSTDWEHARPERRKHFRALMQSLELRRLQAPEPFEHFDYTHPYLHRPLVTFMLSIPAEIVCRPGEPRRLMRRAFRELWPARLRQRRSKEDYTGVFLKSLTPLAAKLLKRDRPLEVVERGYVDRASLEKRLERMTMSLSCNEPQLRNIILLECWLRERFGAHTAREAAGRAHL